MALHASCISSVQVSCSALKKLLCCLGEILSAAKGEKCNLIIHNNGISIVLIGIKISDDLCQYTKQNLTGGRWSMESLHQLYFPYCYLLMCVSKITIQQSFSLLCGYSSVLLAQCCACVSKAWKKTSWQHIWGRNRKQIFSWTSGFCIITQLFSHDMFCKAITIKK